MGLYEKYLLPPLLTKVMSAKPITYQRKKVVPLAQGRVLEIGIGAGHNIPFYNRAKVSSVIGLEPSHAMRAAPRRGRKRRGFRSSSSNWRRRRFRLRTSRSIRFS